MSVIQEGRAWAIQVEDFPQTTRANQKLVLQALAWCADHDGSNAKPGDETLVEMTSLSERAIRYALTALKSQGLIVLVHGGGGRRIANNWHLNLPEPIEPRQRSLFHRVIGSLKNPATSDAKPGNERRKTRQLVATDQSVPRKTKGDLKKPGNWLPGYEEPRLAGDAAAALVRQIRKQLA